MPRSDTVALSELIPTRDEERNLATRIRSVAWADEIARWALRPPLPRMTRTGRWAA